jgi:hypothetical protein
MEDLLGLGQDEEVWQALDRYLVRDSYRFQLTRAIH